MSTRAYGQYCGFARALEAVGERWAFMVVRDLLVGPKRFTDLLRGLHGIPTNILTARLKELEQAGVVRRRLLAPPERSIVYELTEYGAELEDVVIRLGRWGAKTLNTPRPHEIVTADSLIMALRSTFRPEHAGKLKADYELRAGDIVIHARVREGTLTVAEGALDDPDIIIEAGPGIKLLMSGEVTPEAAVRTGAVKVKGDARLLKQFARMFRIDPMPAKTAS